MTDKWYVMMIDEWLVMNADEWWCWNENVDFYLLGHILPSLLACIVALEESNPSGKKLISLVPSSGGRPAPERVGHRTSIATAEKSIHPYLETEARLQQPLWRKHLIDNVYVSLTHSLVMPEYNVPYCTYTNLKHKQLNRTYSAAECIFCLNHLVGVSPCVCESLSPAQWCVCSQSSWNTSLESVGMTWSLDTLLEVSRPQNSETFCNTV